MKKELKFIFIFLIFSSSLYFITSIFYSKDLPIIGTSDTALTLNAIISLMGIDSMRIADTINLPNNTQLEIIFECTGVIEMLIISSIILSNPTTIINKLYGILLGVSLIYVLNMLRLVSISYVLVYYTDRFDFIDRYLWQVSLVFFISLTYTIWLKSIEQSSS